jgi:limonene-1,2-epoxide hydrolase
MIGAADETYDRGPGLRKGHVHVARQAAGMTPLEVVEAFGAAWADHDLDGALAYLSDDCVFEATGPAPDGSRHVGPDAIRSAWKPIFDDDSSKFEPEEIFVAAAGDRVVQRWCYDWGSGHVRGIDLFKVDGDRITEKLSYVKG